MVSYTFKHTIALTCLLLECSILVASKTVISQPSANTIWTPGQTYTIKAQDDHRDKPVQGWQVDLMVLGAECDGICLHDGVVVEISKDYSTECTLQFKVPTDLVQYGKGFHVQFSSAGSPPIYRSETFTIKKSGKGGNQQLQQRNIELDVGVHKNENAAPFVLPTVLATAM
ncbi:hypothetical protein BGZ65_009934, partial [Modicella reniformis]